MSAQRRQNEDTVAWTTVTKKVIQRTFHILWGEHTGTAFAIDRHGRQYLVTAKHVVEGINSGDEIQISKNKQWNRLRADVVGMGDGDVDVAVLACPDQLTSSPPMDTSSKLTFGQPVYFLGFPFGWDSRAEAINNGYPVPFVKTGIVSALPGGNKFYIDGHNNKGFSGGPVVFVPKGYQPSEFHIGGIVSSYPTPQVEPIVNKHGENIVDHHQEPVAYYAENPGLVAAFSIQNAIALIDTNPIVYDLPRSSVDD